MCMQCVGAAAAMVGSASGLRAVLATRSPRWLTAGRLKALTAVLLAGAVVASGINVG
jgi:hypothetical protein